MTRSVRFRSLRSLQNYKSAHHMITRIAHPTDFSSESSAAFLHALRLALEFRCALDLLHVRSPNALEDWTGFPQVRETLSRWGLIDLDASASGDESNLGITVQKVEIAHHDAVGGISEFLLSQRPELIVLATHGQAGLARWLSGSTSERIARQTHIPTLFFGPDARPFVDEQSGKLALKKILVPLARNPSPRGALHALNKLLKPLAPQIQTLHVGDVSPWILDEAGDPISVSLRQGPVVESILKTAETADLIAMPTEGRHGFLDALRGSTTEQVLHQANCPLLALPM